VTCADKEDVALADGDALILLGGFEFVCEDLLAGLEPGHSAEPGDVEQHAAADQTVLQDLDGTDHAPRR
jgi:hypothetical protein